MSSEIRKDYIQDKYVIIAPRRPEKPRDTAECTPAPTPKPCSFCPERIENEESILEIREAGKWLVKVLPNKFPVVSPENSNAYGVQEVVIETPFHEVQLDEFHEAHIEKLLEVYATRTREISKNKKIEYILIFKNSGGKAGASLQHSHSQIFATHFLPPHLLDKSKKMQAYKLRTGRCIYCDVMKRERGGPRMVFEDDFVMAFTPWASLYNYEIWIVPKRHLDNITLLDEKERQGWAKILKRVLQKIITLGLPYNFYFHQVINDEDQHLYMKITPRGSAWAGVEIGSGLIVNPISPEDAAEYYREGQ